MYSCSNCGGSMSYPHGRCPHCNVLLSGVRCQGCGYKDAKSVFISNDHRCPKCGTAVGSGDFSISEKTIVIVVLIIIGIVAVILLAKPVNNYFIQLKERKETKKNIELLKEDIKNRTGVFTDKRNQKEYKTIKIGNQTWMAENLDYYINTGCWEYDTDIDIDTVNYGYLYNWEVACEVCPGGWHLPSDEEWKTLEMYLGMSEKEANDIDVRGTIEGGKLKDVITQQWDNPNKGATNSSGFSALPGGDRINNGYLSHFGWSAYFWTSTESKSNKACYRRLNFGDSKIYRSYKDKGSGLSVRCIKDGTPK